MTDITDLLRRALTRWDGHQHTCHDECTHPACLHRRAADEIEDLRSDICRYIQIAAERADWQPCRPAGDMGGRVMIELIERLRASCENGLHPDDIYAAADALDAQARRVELLESTVRDLIRERDGLMDDRDALRAATVAVLDDLFAATSMDEFDAAWDNARALLADAEQELHNIAESKRWDRSVFDTQVEWGNWVQSRCRHILTSIAARGGA